MVCRGVTCTTIFTTSMIVTTPARLGSGLDGPMP
jgi:hypothetical protein